MQYQACFAFAALGTLAILSGCGEHGGGSPLSPSSLSAGSSQGAPGAGPRTSANLARRVDGDDDGYDDPDSGMPPADPGMYPPPPGSLPSPDGTLPPEGIPPPVQLTISVVGLLQNLSFAPSPLQAAIGNTIVWMNNDIFPHDIVLDDGTPVGNLAPGQSSAPIALMTETMTYHCTIHPSMTGQIVPMPVLIPGEGLPADPSQSPVPDTPGQPSPNPYGDPYDDGYEDDYY
jgi:hypothetical protein